MQQDQEFDETRQNVSERESQEEEAHISSEEDSQASDDEQGSEDETGQKHKTAKARAKSVGCAAIPYEETGLPYLTDTEKTKKGKYGITVPKPFKFTIRDQIKPETISDRRFRTMIAEKEAAESEHLKVRIKPTPIPSKVLEPQFAKIMRQNEERRAKVVADSLELTKQREAPFSFWVRDEEKRREREAMDENAGLNIEC